MFKKVFFMLIAAAVFFGSLVTVEAAPLITLERAKSMAREQGIQTRTTRLAFSRAETSLAQMRRQLGIGLFTVDDLGDELEKLEAAIAERANAVSLLEESSAAWQKELAALKAGDPAASALHSKIANADREIAEYNRQLNNLRSAYTSMVPRYYEQKDREEQAGTQLRSAEAGLESASDALLTQPRISDFNVEQSYLSLLATAGQRTHQELVVQNLEKMLQREQRLLKLGHSTSLSLSQAETRLLQGQQGALSLRQREESLQRAFRRLLGLPADFAFALAEVKLTVPAEYPVTGAPKPDLTATLAYRRALESLEDKRDDFEDLAGTNEFDRTRYRAAELAVDDAALNLQNTLTTLTNNYLTRAEALQLASVALRNSELSLQNSHAALARARQQHRLGRIALLELEQHEISFSEAGLNLFTARQDYHLALQAYQLAREGINPDTTF